MSVRFRYYDLYDNRIKSNFVILNISDVHSNIESLNNILNNLDEIKPDIITVAGDLLDSAFDVDNDKLLRIVKFISTKYPIYIVLGNHDYVSIKDFKSRHNRTFIKDIPFYNDLKKNSDAKILIDNNEVFKVRYDINIMGLNLSQTWYKKDLESKEIFDNILDKYMKDINVDKDKFNVLLLHSSNGIVNKGKLKSVDGINLILSGHNHAGVTPEFIQKISKRHIGIAGPYEKFFIRDAYGYWTSNETSLILSNGLTKLGRMHGPKWMRDLVNNTLRCDAEVIKLHHGENHVCVLTKKCIKK